jgi:hypothetical protein
MFVSHVIAVHQVSSLVILENDVEALSVAGLNYLEDFP